MTKTVFFQDSFLVSGIMCFGGCGVNIDSALNDCLDECKQEKSDAWKKYPKRMLRNKSIGQCVRVAFGISEILDDEEADRIKSGERDITPQATPRAKVDYQAIESSMSEVTDIPSLNALCASIREDFDKRGIWKAESAILVEMKTRHKSRIESLQSSSVESEFEEAEVTEIVRDASEPENADGEVPFE